MGFFVGFTWIFKWIKKGYVILIWCWKSFTFPIGFGYMIGLKGSVLLVNFIYGLVDLGQKGSVVK